VRRGRFDELARVHPVSRVRQGPRVLASAV
jgi:hypothetical protein